MYHSTRSVLLPHSPHEITIDKFLSLMYQGKFIFTVQSTYTGSRYTYKIIAAHKKNVYWVSILRGNNNYQDYTYIGCITDQQEFAPNDKRISSNAPSVTAFKWLWNYRNSAVQMNKVKLYHEGRCARCMRKLTDPESIERGLGAECYSIINS